MSTGLECELTEVEPGRWYYVLEDSDAPRNAWDWREYATAYGPFTSEQQAEEHLEKNHANPGGLTISRYEPGFEPDDVLAALLRNSRV
ncbi:hypothetical protein [Streptomyces humi]